MQAQVGGRVTVTAIRSLHDGESPWWINLRSPDDSLSAVVLRTPSRRIRPDQLATNAAALALAENYGLPAPRLLGTDFDGRNAGVPVTLETVIASMSRWPAKGSPGLLRSADLCELRKQVAIFYGHDALTYVLEGWERASDAQADDVPYWDAVAALNTPTESYSPLAADRRDEFLSAAIAKL
jgi:hypothetical protein